MTAEFEQVDFFADESLLEDPYAYFDHLRSKLHIEFTPASTHAGAG